MGSCYQSTCGTAYNRTYSHTFYDLESIFLLYRHRRFEREWCSLLRLPALAIPHSPLTTLHSHLHSQFAFHRRLRHRSNGDCGSESGSLVLLPPSITHVHASPPCSTSLSPSPSIYSLRIHNGFATAAHRSALDLTRTHALSAIGFQPCSTIRRKSLGAGPGRLRVLHVQAGKSHGYRSFYRD